MRKLDTLGNVLAEGRIMLREKGIESAALDARLLLQDVTGLEHGELLLHLDRFSTDAELDQYTEYLVRRMGHEPVSRILGTRAFYGREFLISDDVLDPRPDTETVVDLILKHFDNDSELEVLDMGAGSGAIILTLLAERPKWFGVAIDASTEALETVLENSELLGVGDRLDVIASFWWEELEGVFDLIVSNPPYIPKAEIGELSPDVRLYDPHIALDGGTDGLDAYRAIAERAGEFLKPDGLVVLEIGQGQEADVAAIWAQHNFKLIESRKDLAGITRVLAFAKA